MLPFASHSIITYLLILRTLPILAQSSTKAQYKVGQAIPVSCLNRTVDTGEHVTDEQGRLEYIPFPTCNETGRPLELYFGIEREINCTIDFISDELYHVLEFYIHADAPLTCRIPSRPLPSSLDPTAADPSSNALIKQQPDIEGSEPLTDPSETMVGILGSENTFYIPLSIALTGILQRSHLHISASLNLLAHAAPKHIAPGVIDAATAYSTNSRARGLSKLVIGDPLPLRFAVRWYPSTSLPSGWEGCVAGHLHWSAFVYCLLSAGASAAVCVVYFRGVELPKRLKGYSRDRESGGGSMARGRYNGYAYMGSGGGGGGTGKID